MIKIILKECKYILLVASSCLLFASKALAQFLPPPDLLSPANGSTNLTPPVTLEWDNSAGSSYRVQVSPDASFNNLIIDVSGLTNTSYELNTLSSNTTYYWRVKGSTVLLTSEWSEVWNFTTAEEQTVPPAPDLVSPLNGSSDTSLNPVLVWESVFNADYYQLQVATDVSFNNLVFNNENITSTSYQVGPLNAGSEYFWRVNAKNDAGTSDWSSVWNFTTAQGQTIPSVPVLVSPANGSNDISLTPVLTWENISNADYYHLQVAKDGSFATLISDVMDIVSNSYQLGTLEEGTEYFWRVNARNDAGTSDWSSVWNFTTVIQQTIPSPPVLISPSDGTTNESLYPILTWDESAGADHYRVQVGLDSNFVNKVYDDSIISLTYVQIGPLNNGVQYFWRVNARNNAGVSEWSDVWNFTTTNEEVLIPQQLSPTDGSRNLPLTTVCTWSSLENAQEYQILVSTQPDFGSIFNNDSTTSTNLQLENLTSATTFFWKVRAKVNNNWHQYSAPWQFTTRNSTPNYINIDTTINFPFYENISQYKSSDYKIVGIPGSSHIPINNFLPGTIGKDWQAYWDNGAPDNYLVEYNENDFFYSIGKAFWIIKKGDMRIAATIENAPQNSKNNVEVPLHNGWNLITNPLTTPVPWDSIKTINSISEPIYSFDGSYSISNRLMPFKGFYFFNATNLSILQVPTNISSDTRSAVGEYLHKLTDSKGWVVNIKLTSMDYVDSIAWIGVSSLVRNEFNSLDIHKPRNWGSAPSIYFNRPEWNEDYPVFASDIRPSFSESSEWTFEIKSTVWKQAELSFNLDEVPDYFDIFLFNPVASKWINIRENTTYQFVPFTETTSFKLKIGKGLKEELITSGPKNFELGNNFPNPFNLSTTIPVTVPEKSEVEISVFNVLGNQVKTIYRGTLDAGQHLFRWDGTDEKGNVSSSGVYFYRLNDDNQKVNTMKKMMLVK